MKCKICGYEIGDNIICPGCDTKVEELIAKGYVIGKPKKNKNVGVDFVVDNSGFEDTEHQKFKKAVDTIEQESKEILNKKIEFEDIVSPESKDFIEEVKTVEELESPKEPLVDMVENLEPVVIPSDHVPSVKNDNPISEELYEPKEEKPKKKTLLSIILFILFALILAATYFGFIYVNPSNVFKRFLNTASNNMYEVPGGNRMVTITSFYTPNGHVLDDLTFEALVYMSDKTNGKMALKILEDGELINESELVRNGNMMYAHDSKISEQYIAFDDIHVKNHPYIKALEFINNFNSVEALAKKVYQELPKVLNSKNFSKDFVKSSNKIKILYNDLSFNETLKNILNYVKNDKVLLNSLANLVGLTPDNELINIDNFINTMSGNYNLYIGIETDVLSREFYEMTLNLTNGINLYELNIKFEDNNVSTIKFVNGANTYMFGKNLSSIDIERRDGNLISNMTLSINYDVAGVDLVVDGYVDEEIIREDAMNALNSNPKLLDIYNATMKKYFEIEESNEPEENIEPLDETTSVEDVASEIVDAIDETLSE